MTLSQMLLQAIEAAAVPVPTADLVAAFGDRPHARSQVWNALQYLHRSGLVRRRRVLDPETGCRTLWRPA